MNIGEDIESFKKNIKGKKVGVIGIGTSNTPLVEYLVKLGADVTAMDKKEDLGKIGEKFSKLGVKTILGENYLSNLNEFDCIFRSPRNKTIFKRNRGS